MPKYVNAYMLIKHYEAMAKERINHETKID